MQKPEVLAMSTFMKEKRKKDNLALLAELEIN